MQYIVNFEYCLNYAGCKEIEQEQQERQQVTYCLNYAGCKGYIKKISRECRATVLP